MKKFIKYTAAVALLAFSSCSEETLIDEVFEGTTRGAVLRTISVSGNTFNVLDASSSLSVTVSADDSQDGALLQSVDVFVSIIDNTPENGTTAPSEALLTNIPSSSFSPGSFFGRPEGGFTTSFGESVAAMGLTEDQYFGGDVIQFRLAINLTDGRTFTNNAGGTVSGGSFFRSPFQYSAQLVCELNEWPAGDWIVDMVDTYGDGWQTSTGGGGPGLTVTLSDGSVLEAGLCTPYETPRPDCTADFSAGTAILTFPSGITSADWNFPGDFYGEIGFTVTSPNGNVVLDVAPATGVAGSQALNLCRE